MWTWNGWNPFKSKQKDDNGTSSEQSGKENLNVRVLDNSGVQSECASVGSRNGQVYPQTGEIHGVSIKTQENNLSLLSSPLRNSSCNKSVVGHGHGGQDKLNHSRSRPNSKGHDSVHSNHGHSHSESNYKGTVFKSMEDNNSPSLSTPIVPQIKRALESKLGLRRPQTPEEEFLHYLSVTRSTAGQLPYVKLKKRDSLTLSDLVDGKIPLSPNTVKLARPEQRHLPPPPRFKSTPVMVSTQASRPCVMDTQTVVSALREKRKRLGLTQQAETVNEDSWHSSAKRRRQDSSQSNASSVSMPSMPEALPNLIGSPGASLLHIENLTDQRPSTVPAVDTFMGHQQRRIGLGGPASPAQSQQFYPSPQLQQQSVASNTNNKTVLRSLQASLSSSQRHMAKVAMLNQQGIDNKRLRSLSKPPDTPRKTLFTEEIAAAAKSQSESLVATSEQENMKTVSPLSTSAFNQTSVPDKVSPSTYASPARREIAKGVYLRRRYSTTNPTDKAPTKTSPGNPFASADDFEKDRKREYKRRMIELFGEEDDTEAKALLTPPSTTLSTIQPSAPAQDLSSSPGLNLSSAVTSAAVSASLDSLNKLVQSATSSAQQLQQTSLAAASNANSLSELLKPNEGNVGDSSTKPSLTNPVGTTSSSSVVSPDGGLLFSLGAPAKSGGFNFGTPLNKPGDSLLTSGLNTGSNTSAITSTANSLTIAGPTGFNFSPAPSSTAASGEITFGNPVSKANATTTAAGSEGILSNSVTFPPPTVSSASQGFSFSSVSGSTAPAFNMPNKMPDLQSSSGQVAEPNASKASSNAPSVAFTFGTTSSASSLAPVTFGQTASITSSSSLNSGQGINSAPFTLGSTTNTASVGSSLFNFGQTTLSTASTAPSFNFGQASGATGTFGSSNTKNVSSSGSTPVGFGHPTSNSNSAPFNFGQATTTANSASFVMGQTTMANAAPFSFGQTAPTNVSTTSFNFGQTAPTNVSTAPFSFGKGEPLMSSNATPFGFGQSTATTISTSSLSFGPMGSTNSISSTFGFGQQAAVPKAYNTTSLGFSQTAPAGKTSTASFRQVPNLTSGNTANFNFGQMAATSTASSSPLNFSQASNNSTTKPFAFGVQSTQPSATSIFGSTPAIGMPSTVSLFGSTNAVTSLSSSVFGSSNAAQAFSNAPSLGSSTGFGSSLSGFGNSSAPSFNPSGTSTTFSLSAATTTAPVFGSAPASAFGSSAAPASAFGSSAAPSSVFGISAAPSSAFGSIAAPSSAFGSSAASAPAFGSSAAPTSAFGSSAAPASTFGTSVGSIFGAPTSKSFSFGSTPASTSSTPVFGVATTSSAFGTSAPSISIFGAKPATSNAGFGAPATTSSSTFVTSPIFGASTGTQQPAFGGPTPAFGSSQQNAAFNPPAFGSQSGASTTGFGTSNPPALFGTPAFQPSFTGSSPSVIGFGSQASNTGGFNFAQPAGNSGFNFSAQATPRPAFSAPAPGGFNFSNQTTPGGAFNFGATPSTPLMANRPRAAAGRPARRGGARR